MTIGDRLKEERERLKLSQTAFGAIDGTGKKTVISWEKNLSSPTATFLEKASKHNVDVLYILTGIRLPAQQQHVVTQEYAEYAVNSADNKVSFFAPSEIKSLVVGKEHTVDYDELMRRLTLTPSDRKFMGERIRFERQVLRFKIGTIASMCNVPENVWKEYESGERPIENRILHTFSLFGGDLLYIMTGIRDMFTSKNMTESTLLSDFREIPADRKRIVLECMKENIYQEGDDDLPPEKRGGLRWSPISD